MYLSPLNADLRAEPIRSWEAEWVPYPSKPQTNRKHTDVKIGSLSLNCRGVTWPGFIGSFCLVLWVPQEFLCSNHTMVITGPVALPPPPIIYLAVGMVVTQDANWMSDALTCENTNRGNSKWEPLIVVQYDVKMWTVKKKLVCGMYTNQPFRCLWKTINLYNCAERSHSMSLPPNMS